MILRDLAGDSVPVRTRSAPSCSRRSKDFSGGGKPGLSSTESYTDSLPVGPSGFPFAIPDDLAFMMLTSSVRTLCIVMSKLMHCLVMKVGPHSHQIMPAYQ